MKYIAISLLFLYTGLCLADASDDRFQNELYHQLVNLHEELEHHPEDRTSSELKLDQIRLRLRPFATFTIEEVAEVKAAPQIEFYFQR